MDLVGAYYRVHGGNSYERTRLDLDQVRRSIAYMSTTRRYISRLQQQGNDSFLKKGARVDDSVTFVGHRLISMKLEPGLHPVQADTLSGLYFAALAATHRRFDVGLPMKVLYNLWFSLMVVAPRPVAKWLTHWFLFTDNRRDFNRLLRVLRAESESRSPSTSSLWTLVSAGTVLLILFPRSANWVTSCISGFAIESSWLHQSQNCRRFWEMTKMTSSGICTDL